MRCKTQATIPRRSQDPGGHQPDQRQRNNYFDGPFDQLTDNCAEEVEIAKYMQLANPTLKGRIDQFGYFNDTDRPMWVSLSNYYRTTSTEGLNAFISRIRTFDDPYRFISHR